MANLTITAIDNANVILEGTADAQETLTFAAADTYVEGTILARQEVAIAVTPAAGTNTGDGTVTLATVVAGPVVPLVGAYVLTVTEAVTHGGVFSLVDPNGAQVASGIEMTAATGGTTVIEVAGLQFTITDGATDFIVGDSFTLTTTADGKLVAFAVDGAGGAQIPKAVLTYDVTVAAAGDVAISAFIIGRVNKDRLVIDADGDATNVDAAVTDQLRDYGIEALTVSQLADLDNQ